MQSIIGSLIDGSEDPDSRIIFESDPLWPVIKKCDQMIAETLPAQTPAEPVKPAAAAAAAKSKIEMLEDAAFGEPNTEDVKIVKAKRKRRSKAEIALATANAKCKHPEIKENVPQTDRHLPADVYRRMQQIVDRLIEAGSLHKLFPSTKVTPHVNLGTALVSWYIQNRTEALKVREKAKQDLISSEVRISREAEEKKDIDGNRSKTPEEA